MVLGKNEEYFTNMESVMEKCIWTGQSGEIYPYDVFAPNVNWRPVGGNYIFASIVDAHWVAHYIGQTNNFKNRFASHEKMDVAVRAGATHILAHVNAIETDRSREEFDLIQRYAPSCNEQLQPLRGLLSKLMQQQSPPRYPLSNMGLDSLNQSQSLESALSKLLRQHQSPPRYTLPNASLDSLQGRLAELLRRNYS